MQWLTTLMDNPYVWAILAVISIGSFLYAIRCQYANKERKEFSCVKTANIMVLKKKAVFEKLSIMYDGQDVEDLCVTKLTIWNSGNRTINANDMVASRELTISTNDCCKILDAEIVKISETTNKFRISFAGPNVVKVSFDYADKNDGVVVQVIHTGLDDDIQVDCKIKGGLPLKNVISQAMPKMVDRLSGKYDFEKAAAVLMVMMEVVLGLMSLMGTAAVFFPALRGPLFMVETMFGTSMEVRTEYAIMTSGATWILTLMYGAIAHPIIKHTFRFGVPRKLK